MSRTAHEVVELYNLVVWNERDIALAEELLGDSVTRHEAGEAVVLTHGEAVKRVHEHLEMFSAIRFDLTLKDGMETTVSSIEIFRMVDGRITEVWNCGYKQGVWA
ncbi:nuclear transport factor 2 family protein [Mycolicibacterium sarraceniae]|nr:nuclear transport factor 2 family protein [Mycolicibacterium sarraceniae]